MLIRLRLENLYSFKATEFSMVASTERIHPHHIHPARTRNDVRLTRFAAIYGANAAGKSNLVKALGFAKDLVLRGLRPEAKIPVERFRLDPAYAAGTGTPQFGGLQARQLLAILEAMFLQNVVGMDIVEVAPNLDASLTAVFAARKLISEAWGHVYFKRR